VAGGPKLICERENSLREPVGVVEKHELGHVFSLGDR
jgi:predicted Zn-dependent protease with MMP-like domain